MATVDAQLRPVEREEYWELPLAGHSVTRCYVDHAFGLQFWSKSAEFELRIEGPFTLREPGGKKRSLRPMEVHSLGSALGLFQRRVEFARAYKDGHLDILFSGGWELSVSPDPDYEAWELTGDSGRFVSTAGGDLAVWL